MIREAEVKKIHPEEGGWGHKLKNAKVDFRRQKRQENGSFSSSFSSLQKKDITVYQMNFTS